MLTRIQIEGLFNQFNYNIELKEDGITILTGPNGYGKTTILKIIYAFAVQNLLFFFQIPFEKILLSSGQTTVNLSKTDQDTLQIQVEGEKSKLSTMSFKRSAIIEKNRQLLENSPYMRIEKDRWIDRRTERVYTTKSLINLLMEEHNPKLFVKHYNKQILGSGSVYLIREQRLIRKETVSRRRRTPYFLEEETKEDFANTIEEYANELSSKIKDILAKASLVGRELDSSFPTRLFAETVEVNEEEFNQRYGSIKEKQKSLSLYGLSNTKEDNTPSYKKENAKALHVYLNDTEKKLAQFDDILQKLETFSTILEEKQLAFKKLEFSPEFGFKFKTMKGEELSLTDLSSGEQQEVVLLYELLFRVAPGTLVLIDEPEISLHVAWQKEVLNDLLKILKLQKIAVIVATHSPQIIGEHWDLVVDLHDLSRESQDECEKSSQ